MTFILVQGMHLYSPWKQVSDPPCSLDNQNRSFKEPLKNQRRMKTAGRGAESKEVAAAGSVKVYYYALL